MKVKRLKPMERKETKINFAVCIANTGYEDLEVCKVYRVVADVKAAEVGCLRVIDESGEDYLAGSSSASRKRAQSNRSPQKKYNGR